MKFGIYFEANKILEWSEQYCDFGSLKVCLKKLDGVCKQHSKGLEKKRQQHNSSETKELRSVSDKVTKKKVKKDSLDNEMVYLKSGETNNTDKIANEEKEKEKENEKEEKDDKEKKKYEKSKRQVNKIMEPQFERHLPEIGISIVKVMELQFLEHLTLELIHVSSFYADQCQYFSAQVLFVLIERIYMIS
ncbi:hypothetical protein RFI_27467 [Reticulomyxa filosa]|uniref:SPX domain-containing protein n=1 Tax=Reticulomyxa filosa TaxID=46433 RepID=X6M8Y1_RETFI|nr:hypothetical protein RFI_27467 [Reticulomyxa filosa]|eukprot:ETO09912.1 hypothetical protein RFI_27467 [Reticulomyxa filosa]